LQARTVAPRSAAEGVNLNFSNISHIPNTLAAHRLIWPAQRHCKQDAMVEALFKAYFADAVEWVTEKIELPLQHRLGLRRR